MSPNATELDIVDGNVQNGAKDQSFSAPQEKVALKAVRSVTTLVTHMLVGIVVGICVWYALRFGLPLTTTLLHILLCVIGFQLLMAESILALAPDSWLSNMKLKHKRLIHWVMQIGGSVVAIVGCILMSLSKSINFNTLHGQFALVSMVFTVASLLNGLTSLYAYELRKYIPGILSRLTHICFGIVAFATASISLCYGIDKGGFRNWATTQFADALIVMTAIFTVIIIINPFVTFFNKFRGAVSN
ncbi:unnamed protein product [Diatraea saccharalis]|uniref:ascorbate ferrireductase (transmembrane) n=1 Tax=Diatraea saccharalis TaxID=40085 RepID=A0A9N9R1J0_9NEOP|nr:unnamed protein product [Diatraea saccharalis]